MAKQQNGSKNGSKRGHVAASESDPNMITLKLDSGRSVRAHRPDPLKEFKFKAVISSDFGSVIVAHVRDDALDKEHEVEMLIFEKQADGTFLVTQTVSYYRNERGQLAKNSRSLEAPHQEPIAVSG
ncbi:MAG TPA: hypothetical protein VJC11_03155 [Patescibacteria group bacterium]|nr:hypothetical protein [Patescibacteria group bacterium]